MVVDMDGAISKRSMRLWTRSIRAVVEGDHRMETRKIWSLIWLSCSWRFLISNFTEISVGMSTYRRHDWGNPIDVIGETIGDGACRLIINPQFRTHISFSSDSELRWLNSIVISSSLSEWRERIILLLGVLIISGLDWLSPSTESLENEVIRIAFWWREILLGLGSTKMGCTIYLYQFPW